MNSRIACLRGVFLLVAVLLGGVAQAQVGPLIDEVRTLSNGAPAVEHQIDITDANTYHLTATDLKLPAALASGKIAVTRGTTLVGTVAITPASSSVSLDFEAVPGSYVIRIVGKPGTGGGGSIGVKVLRGNDTNPFNEFLATIVAPSAPIPENQARLETDVTPTVGGTYDVVLADAGLPQSLLSVFLSVTEVGGPQVALLPAAGTASFVATAGKAYRILAIGEADASVSAGLFSIRVRQQGSSTNLFSRTITVGSVEQTGSVTLPAGAAILGLHDLQFPVALAKMAAALVNDGEPAVVATTSGDTPFNATAGTHAIFTVAQAAAGSSGSFGVDVRTGGGASLFSAVKGINGDTGATPSYNIAVDVPTAGAYRVRVADFGFPAAMTSLQVGASQDGKLLGTLSSSGTVDLSSVAAGKLFLLVLATPNGTAGGVLGLDVTASGGTTPIYAVTQGIGNLFQSRPITSPGSSAYRVTLTDVGFPARFKDLGAIVTRGADSIGKVLNSAQFDFNSTPGNYIVTFIATPDATEKAGTYGIRVAEKPASPIVTLTASASQVTVGGAVDLTWSATNATSCTASNGWSGAKATSGVDHITGINAAVTFKIECVGEGGTGSATVSVSAVAAASERGGGGGSLEWLILCFLAGVATWRGMAAFRQLPKAA